jgi:hypothetical protein
MIYVLVWFHFVRSDHLQYYEFDSYSSMEECQVERSKAGALITNNNMLLECVEISRD